MSTIRRQFSRFAFVVASTLALSASFGTTEDAEARPMLAIWRDFDHKLQSEAPYLRIAIWNDGKVVFAQDPSKWSHGLRQGKIDAASLSELKNAIKATGVFELKGTAYLVPDAPVDCLMLDLTNKQQMLYWDEVESARYGINISPKPHHLEFKKCWKEVNKLALAAIPKGAEPHKERFREVPKSWRLKKPIQSE